MDNHLRNLSRQVGGDVTDKYRFITSSDELYKAFRESKADLHYALKKETQRDRYIITNSEALEQAIVQACGQALQDASEPLAHYLEGLAYDVFSCFATGENKPYTSLSKTFIEIFTKAFILSVFKIFERNFTQ